MSCGGEPNQNSLKSHLKECCGYGQYPPVVECPPKSSDAAQANNCSCSRPPTPANNCYSAPAPSNNVQSFNPRGTCPKQENPCGKCPPMPKSDVSQCVPNWICAPPLSNYPQYPAPPGAVILPISVGGRTFQGKCGESAPATNVANKNCPVVRPRCPEKPAEQPAKTGFFAKITSFFGGNK